MWTAKEGLYLIGLAPQLANKLLADCAPPRRATVAVPHSPVVRPGPAGAHSRLRSVAAGVRRPPVQPSAAHIEAFYRAGALGLAWLDARERNPRRFGPAAEAHWRNYAASPPVLTELDRLELLLRDAASLYPDAFGARAVFDLHHLTPDEPFGNLDVQPAPGLASKLLRPDTEAPADLAALLRQAARAWEMDPVVAPAVPSVGPTARVIVAGAAALCAVALRFADDRSLSFAEQVFVLSDAPALRHLAGLAALGMGQLQAPRVIVPAQAEAVLGAERGGRVDVVVCSDDAEADARTAAEAWAPRTTA